MLKWARGVLGKAGKVSGLAVAAVVVGVATLGNSAMAADAITMPIDFADLASSGLTVMGEVIGGVATIFIVTSLVSMGFKWVRRAFNS